MFILFHLPTIFSVFQVDINKKENKINCPVCKYSSFLYAYRSEHDIVNEIATNQALIPKRRLLASKVDHQHVETTNEHHRSKLSDDITDPIVIVSSYDRHSSKARRVGWQFRYRVSRYIDSLRHYQAHSKGNVRTSHKSKHCRQHSSDKSLNKNRQEFKQANIVNVGNCD
jgi:hypothetical protein